uniref:Proteasomal ATPase-associated factor 1 n=2 Tax=Schistocephalus solidus TaxID=70667 RepID=A0A0V0JAY7_SCHSO
MAFQFVFRILYALARRIHIFGSTCMTLKKPATRKCLSIPRVALNPTVTRSSVALSPRHKFVSFIFALKKSILLQDLNRKLQATFRCPDVKFSTIHKITRQPSMHLNSFDVNNTGELAVSAASDQTVLLWETRTGDIRRSFVGHVSEVYCCRFFPSGLVVVTGGADMQLKIWSALTGECAATLRPGSGGADGTGPREPGGHRSSVVDIDFIERGRNIVSLDRSGWLRLWDVSTQVAISAMSVVPDKKGGRVHTNCDIEHEPQCCAVKNRHWLSTPAPDDTEPHSSHCVLETSSSKATTVGVTDKLAAVGTGQGGVLCIYDLTSCDTRKAGPSHRLVLPSASCAVTACCFSRSPSDGNVSADQSSNVPESEGNVDVGAFFEEYGLLAGGADGQVACWDLRIPSKTVFTQSSGKSGVTHLKTYRWPAHRSHGLGNEGKLVYLPSFTGLFVARRDGRVTLQPLSDSGSQPKAHHILELTGPDVDSIRGFSVLAPTIMADDEPSVSAWSATNSGQFFFYRRLAVESLFV